MREGLTLLRARDFNASASRLRRLQALGIDSFEVNFYLGRALAGLGRHREAVRRFEAATARLPTFGPSYLALADSLVASGNLAAAHGRALPSGTDGVVQGRLPLRARGGNLETTKEPEGGYCRLRANAPTRAARRTRSCAS